MMTYIKNAWKTDPMAKRMIIMIAALTVVFGGIFGWNALRAYFIKQFFANFEPPPATISTTQATAQTWQPYLSAVGSLTAVNGVDISTEVPGMVNEVYFQSGQMVKKNDPLIQLDDRIDQENLKHDEARHKLALINFERQKNLFTRNAAAKSALDQASVEVDQAAVAVAKDKILIDEKRIKAPFDGKIGIRKVNVGQYISPGTSLVNLQSLNPLYVEFSLPEQELKSLAVGQEVIIQVDTYPNQEFKGIVAAIHSKVNEQTRNILVQATLPNDDQRLYPGMFANIKVLLAKRDRVITVPQTAIAYSLYGDAVYVVREQGKDKDKKPILRAVKVNVVTGERRGGEVALKQGLKEGEQVIISGQLKLQENSRVLVDNSVNISGKP
jgi:membrane fusion protein (multidrug efflux system)